MADFTDPLNRVLYRFTADLAEWGYAFAVREKEKSIYIWGNLGFFHLEYIETSEFDGWRVYHSDDREELFENEHDVQTYIRKVTELCMDPMNQES